MVIEDGLRISIELADIVAFMDGVLPVGEPCVCLHCAGKLNTFLLSHKSSFIPRTCNVWNALPSSCFPGS